MTYQQTLMPEAYRGISSPLMTDSHVDYAYCQPASDQYSRNRERRGACLSAAYPRIHTIRGGWKPKR